MSRASTSFAWSVQSAPRYHEVLLQARVLAVTDHELDIKTFSLDEVAAMVLLPPDITNGAVGYRAG